MIVTPKNKYDEQMIDILLHDKSYKKLPDGEKSILYDLAHQVHKYTNFDWSNISIDYLLYNISLVYNKNKNKNKQLMYVIADCIDEIFPDLIADIVDERDYKIIVVKDISFKGGKNG